MIEYLITIIMKRSIIVIGLSFCMLIGQRVVGYYPYWVQNEYPANNIDLNIVTHVNHAFAWPDENGNILHYNNMLNGSLNQTIHDGGGKILLSIGGWGNDEGFAAVAASSELRTLFISNLIDICDTYGYDGIDMNWEHPFSNEDRQNLNYLMSEMDSIFNAHNSELLITMAVPISNWAGQWYDFSILRYYIDYFNAMTYDIHGSWSGHAGHNSPLYPSPPGDSDGSCSTGINYLLYTRGIPENKINLGLPFWGKKYITSDINGSFSGEVNDLRYYEIPGLIGNGWEYQWDSDAYCPYLIKDDQSKILTYDDQESIRYKCEYAIEKELGGVMIWALGYDMTSNGQELIQSIEQNYIENQHVQEYIIPDHFYLKAYPNPFNQSCMLEIEISKNIFIKVSIHDLLGDQVHIIINKVLSKGRHNFSWNAQDQLSGVYFIRTEIGDRVEKRKIMLLK